MKIGERGLNLIKESEGLRLKPYLCPAGIPTIGYGNTYYDDDNETKVTLDDKPITVERAEELLRNIIDTHYSKFVNKYVTVELNQNQFDALVSFSYNVGVGNLKHSTLLRKLNSGDYTGASEEFSRWNKSKGRVLKGLTKRRLNEKLLFLNGE